jgi:hypothetical protein
MTRGNMTFSIGAAPTKISDHNQEAIGFVKKEIFSFGNRYRFNGERGHDTFVLTVKTNFLGSVRELFINKIQAALITNKPTIGGDFFREGKFSRALCIDSAIPINDVRRQVLLAFAIALPRLNR